MNVRDVKLKTKRQLLNNAFKIQKLPNKRIEHSDSGTGKRNARALESYRSRKRRPNSTLMRVSLARLQRIFGGTPMELIIQLKIERLNSVQNAASG